MSKLNQMISEAIERNGSDPRAVHAEVADGMARRGANVIARRLVRQFVAEQGAALAEVSKLWDAPRIG